MSGNSILLDTNIVLYLLSGDDKIASFLNEKQLSISFITELELLCFVQNDTAHQSVIHSFLSDVYIMIQLKHTLYNYVKKGVL